MTTTTTDTRFLSLDTFRAERDGCLAYLVVDEASRTALAIDPRLDQVDEILEALAARDVRLTHVLDTHTHADHLSGVAPTRPADRRHRAGARGLEAEAAGPAGHRRHDLRARHEDRDGPGRPWPHARLARHPRGRPPVHGRRPLRRRRRADRLHGRQRLGPLRHASGLRGPPGRHGGAPRPRLRRPPGDHDRRGEGAESPPARARPRGVRGSPLRHGIAAGQHGRDPPAQPRRGRGADDCPPGSARAPRAGVGAVRAVDPRRAKRAGVRGRADRGGASHPAGRARRPARRDPRAGRGRRGVPHGRARHHRGRDRWLGRGVARASSRGA